VPQQPLSDEELIALRAVLVEASHTTWLRRQLKVFVPVAFAIVSGVYAFFNWLIPHWKST
jgi:hypothetical protein